MKKLLLTTLLLSLSSLAIADTYVQGYTRSNGTYVSPHYRTSPDSTINNNYSTRGNTNPYTGQPGYIQPQYGYPQPQFVPQPLNQEPNYEYGYR